MNYQRIYDSLMHRAKDRAVEGYVERHHVLPKSMGGGNEASNLVSLTAREHFLAHWLLFRIHHTRQMARAFRLMVDDTSRRRGRDYAAAKAIYAESMVGDQNVSKRASVRAAISQYLQGNHPYAGKKRPDHAEKMREKGLIAGEKNPFFGCGERQRGAKNHMAKAVRGVHKYGLLQEWNTLQDAADFLGVTIQAVSQSIRKGFASKGWRFEHIS